MVILYGNEVMSYNLLVLYASKVLETNLGTITIVEKDSKQLRCAFFAFCACIV